MNWIKQLLIGAMLTVQSYFPSKEQSLEPIETEQGELNPQRKWTRFDYLIHHDDVTPEEEEDLFSDDPERIMRAEAAIFQRQEEFQEVWDNKELLKEIFQEDYLGAANFDRPQVTTEDFDELDIEGFEGVNPVTGDLEYIRFDDLEEWQNNEPER